MMITSVKVKKLYGLHNYDISFNEEERVKIIHAPNGFGKTTILKLIRGILEGDLKLIGKVPFEFFIINFKDEIYIKVIKSEHKVSYELHTNAGTKCYLIDDDEGICEDLLDKLKIINRKMPIYFIDANRLWIENHNYNEKGKSLLPTVLEYAKELSEWMREALAQSNFCGQELDRTFPARLIRYINNSSSKVMTIEEIKNELNDLEEKRTVLEKAGLFATTSEPLPDNIDLLDEEMLKVITLYIEDSKEKLKVFERLATKINLLCNLINKRFSYKVMEVNMKDGFVFKVPTQEKLKADKLSSGEQNELILMFMLLFKAPQHSIILMDEPEISLHIAWQQSFLDDMEEISKLSDIRMMIATHSPDIINGRWDLTTGLEEEE